MLSQGEYQNGSITQYVQQSLLSLATPVNPDPTPPSKGLVVALFASTYGYAVIPFLGVIAAGVTQKDFGLLWGMYCIPNESWWRAGTVILDSPDKHTDKDFSTRRNLFAAGCTSFRLDRISGHFSFRLSWSPFALYLPYDTTMALYNIPWDLFSPRHRLSDH